MDKEKVKVKLRGHNLFCAYVMNMDGDPIYGPRFCANSREYQKMMADPTQVIEVVKNAGDTCRYCPSWNESDNKCLLYDYQSGANKIDLDMLQALNLNFGDTITSGELKKRIKERFGDELPPMCSWACGFESLCDCNEGLGKL